MTDENMNMPVQAGAKSKMLYWIIGGILVLVLLGWFVPHVLGFAAMRAVGAAQGVNIDQHMDGSATYSNSQGSVTVGGGATMPSNWPSDAPAIYSGGSIQYSGTSNPQTGKAGSAVVYTVNATATAVVDYYKAQLSRSGWTIEATANTGAATVLSAKKDTRSIGVYIVDAGNGAVSVTAGIEM